MRHRYRAEVRSGEARDEWVSGEDCLSEDVRPRTGLPPLRLAHYAKAEQARRIWQRRRFTCALLL
jgi:hypothetical protein